MPVRLMELVNKYPYGSPASDDDVLPRPRFSTRQYDAILIRVETQLTTQRKPKHSPSKLISDAFEAEIVAEEQEYKELWDQIKSKRGICGGETPPGDGPDFGRVFADETIRFLSLLPDEEPGSPTYSLFKKSNRKRSLSLNDQDLSAPPSPTSNNGTTWHAKVSTDPAKVTTITPINRPGTRDWTQFSTSGFAESGTIGTRLAATLMEKDMEISIPAAPGKNSRFATSPSTNRRSMEGPGGLKLTTTKEEQPLTSSNKVAQFSSVQIDEAFIDFWGDALTDPISCNWPPFVLCKLKSDAGIKTKSGKAVDWLVIERSYIQPAIPEPQSPDGMSESGGRRATSPRPSIASQGTFSSAKKRFSIFNTSGSRMSLDKKFAVPGRKKANSLTSAQQKAVRKSPSSVRVGEMGEVLREEDEKETPKARPPSLRPRKSLDPTKTSVSGETGPVPPLPSAPASGKEDAATVQSSTQGGVTKSDLATASTAAVVVAVAAASDFSSTTERALEHVSDPVDQQIPSSAVTSAQASAPQSPPAAVPETESLGTVVEVAEEPAVPQTSSTRSHEVVQEEVTATEAVVEPTPPPTVEDETSPAIQPISSTEEVEEANPAVEPTSSTGEAEEVNPAVEATSSAVVEDAVSVTVEPTSFPPVTDEAAPVDDEPAPLVEETETTAVESTALLTLEDATLTVDESTSVPEAPAIEDALVESAPTLPAVEPEVVVEAEQVNLNVAFEEPAAEVAPTAAEPEAEEGPREPPSEDLTQQETKSAVEGNGHADDAVPRED
jgi:hypothetical protein